MRGCASWPTAGMISAETMAELDGAAASYILGGTRERTGTSCVRDLVLEDRAPFVPLTMKKRGKEATTTRPRR